MTLTLRARLFRTLHRLRLRALAVASRRVGGPIRKGLLAALAAFDGVWLGVLDRMELDALDEDFYAHEAGEDVEGRFLGYCDEAYLRSGLFDWEEEGLEAFPATGRLVVTSAGSGREVLALVKKGYDAIGFEPNAALVSAGAAHLGKLGFCSARLRLAERNFFPAEAGSCDGVLVGWAGYMHIVGRSRRIDYLRLARASLAAGAPLLLSFKLRTDSRYFRLSAGIANAIRRLRRSPQVELGDVMMPTYLHLFTLGEISSELAAAGFEVERLEAVPYGYAVARATG